MLVLFLFDVVRAYSAASILSKYSASRPDTKSLIRSRGCPGGGGVLLSRRRQKRHSQRTGSSGEEFSLTGLESIVDSWFTATAKSSKLRGK